MLASPLRHDHLVSRQCCHLNFLEICGWMSKKSVDVPKVFPYRQDFFIFEIMYYLIVVILLKDITTLLSRAERDRK